MTSLFQQSGALARLRRLARSGALLAFDFDGTLSRIVRDPDAAGIGARTAELLGRLAKLAPVAVISGRSVADLRARLPFQPRYLVGNHGLEGPGRSRTTLARAKRACAAWKRSLATLDPSVELEDKAYSLALHFRSARNKSVARNSISAHLSCLDPVPHVIGGKSVVNLLPPGLPNKGTALLALARLSRRRGAFYIGDDDTDEDVFSLSGFPGELFTVRVGRKASSGARHFIARQAEINRVLEALVGAFERS